MARPVEATGASQGDYDAPDVYGSREPIPLRPVGEPTPRRPRAARRARSRPWFRWPELGAGQALLMLLVTVITGLCGFWIWTEQRKLWSYVPAQAQVLETSMDQETSTNRRGMTTTKYLPLVRYQYTVGGRSYASSTVFPVPDKGSQKWAAGILARYPVGATVEAWYDPGRPDQSFLVRQRNYAMYLVSLVPAALFVMAVQHVWKEGRARAAQCG